MNVTYNSLRFNLNTDISATGLVGEYDVSNEVCIRFVTERATSGNVITVSGRIRGASTYDLLGTLTGLVNQTVIVDTYDLIKIECTTYGSSASSVKLIACSFNRL